MIKPLHDYVLVQRKESQKESESNIILVENPQDKNENYIGEVLSTGPGRRSYNGELSPMSVEEGQTILYKQYQGHQVSDEEEKWLISEKDILAVLED